MPVSVPHMRAILLALVLAIAFLGTTPASTSAAEPETACQGKVPTVTSSTSSTTLGTEGDDVILATSADVYGLGGNDTICLVGPTVVTLLAGPGNDSVTVSDDKTGVNAVLGDGDDTYVGGPGFDNVSNNLIDETGEQNFFTDSGGDHIDTGAGPDSATVGQPFGPVEADVVELGDGADRLIINGPTADASTLVGGADIDQLSLGRSNTVVSLNIPARLAQFDGARVAQDWEGFEEYVMYANNRGTLQIKGSSGADQVRMTTAGAIQGDLGAGSDTLKIRAVRIIRGGVAGGTGRDLIIGSAENYRPDSGVNVDLADRRLWAQGTPRSASLRIDGFEDASVLAPLGRITGSKAANQLSVRCGSVDGGYGGDVIQQLGSDTVLTDGGFVVETEPKPSRCEEFSSFHADGGPGADRITGSLGNDILIGGSGHDRADGLSGRDRCSAEVRRRCEQRTTF